MWRRKAFHPFRRLRMVSAFNGQASYPQIRKAHQLFSSGKYSESATIFESIAEAALINQLPQAPQLFLQTGVAHIKANEIENGIFYINKGMQVIIDRQQWGYLRKTVDMTVNRLRKLGLSGDAKNLIIWAGTHVPEEIKNSPLWLSKQENMIHPEGLPKECPNCGGPVNPREIDWFGSDANCIYCGSLLTGS